MLNVSLRPRRVFAATRPPMNLAPKTKADSSSAAAPARPRKSRARGRVEHEVRPRARRAAHDRPERGDVDSLYLRDMAESRLLTVEQEVQLAERIIGAERSLIEALVRAPSGAAALCKLE